MPAADRVLPLMWPVTFTVGAMIHGAGSEDPPATCESGTEGRGAANRTGPVPDQVAGSGCNRVGARQPAPDLNAPGPASSLWLRGSRHS